MTNDTCSSRIRAEDFQKAFSDLVVTSRLSPRKQQTNIFFLTHFAFFPVNFRRDNNFLFQYTLKKLKK